MQCVGYDNCHQLVFQEIVEFVETTIRKNRHLANPLPCQKIQVIVIQGYSYFMNMQKCKDSWFFRNLVEAQVAEDHFSFEQVKRCSPKHYSLYSF